jgi:hypothetical protein
MCNIPFSIKIYQYEYYMKILLDDDFYSKGDVSYKDFLHYFFIICMLILLLTFSDY